MPLFACKDIWHCCTNALTCFIVTAQKHTTTDTQMCSFIKKLTLSPNNGHGRRVLLCWGSYWARLGEGGRTRHITSSLGAAHTRLQAVLIAGSALEGFEGICEAVAEHGHLAAMAHWARNEGEASTGLAQLRVLDPLERWRKLYRWTLSPTCIEITAEFRSLKCHTSCKFPFQSIFRAFGKLFFPSFPSKK